jgi:hypothetical protein
MGNVIDAVRQLHAEGHAVFVGVAPRCDLGVSSSAIFATVLPTRWPCWTPASTTEAGEAEATPTVAVGQGGG